MACAQCHFIFGVSELLTPFLHPDGKKVAVHANGNGCVAKYRRQHPEAEQLPDVSAVNGCSPWERSTIFAEERHE